MFPHDNTRNSIIKITIKTIKSNEKTIFYTSCIGIVCKCGGSKLFD